MHYIPETDLFPIPDPDDTKITVMDPDSRAIQNYLKTTNLSSSDKIDGGYNVMTAIEHLSEFQTILTYYIAGESNRGSSHDHLASALAKLHIDILCIQKICDISDNHVSEISRDIADKTASQNENRTIAIIQDAASLVWHLSRVIKSVPDKYKLTRDLIKLSRDLTYLKNYYKIPDKVIYEKITRLVAIANQ